MDPNIRRIDEKRIRNQLELIDQLRTLLPEVDNPVMMMQIRQWMEDARQLIASIRSQFH